MPEFRTIEAPSTWKLFPRHPVSEEYEDLDAPVAKRMQAGIAKFGVMLREVVLKREQGGLCVLDGWQMYQGCIAADVKPGFVELVGGIEPAEFVEIKNDCRRHEDAEKKAKRLKNRKAKIKEMVANGATVKDAAKKLGVGRSTAFRDLKVESKSLPRCERCERLNATGDDCPRCQLLRMDQPPEEAPPPEEEEKPEAPECISKTKAPLLDANFFHVPAEALEAFEVSAKMASLCHDLDKIGKELAKILAHKVGARALSPTIAQRVKDVRSHLWQARATHVCAYCKGEGGECEACHGELWLPSARFSTAPKEMQDAMRKLGAKNVPI